MNKHKKTEASTLVLIGALILSGILISGCPITGILPAPERPWIYGAMLIVGVLIISVLLCVCIMKLADTLARK